MTSRFDYYRYTTQCDVCITDNTQNACVEADLQRNSGTNTNDCKAARESVSPVFGTRNANHARQHWTNPWHRLNRRWPA